MALGAAAVLLISGAVLALVPSTEVAASEDATVVTAEDASDQATLDLSMNVLVRAGGESITMPGVNVSVYSVDITEGEDNTTMVIERVAEGQTDADGNVTFQLPEGEYAVSASYQGLKGFAWVNLTEDRTSTVQLCGCGEGMMGPQCFQGNGTCDRSRDRDRLMERDMDGISACCLWESCCGERSSNGPS